LTLGKLMARADKAAFLEQAANILEQAGDDQAARKIRETRAQLLQGA
jgi:hypothetical protein